MCKAPVRSSPPNKPTSNILHAGCPSVTQLTVSQHWRRKHWMEIKSYQILHAIAGRQLCWSGNVQRSGTDHPALHALEWIQLQLKKKNRTTMNKLKNNAQQGRGHDGRSIGWLKTIKDGLVSVLRHFQHRQPFSRTTQVIWYQNATIVEMAPGT